jgi:hypothetical protein
MIKNKHLILLFLFAGIALFLTFNKHSKSGYFNYHSELWADKSGYYVYLPAAFKYNFEANKFPDSIDYKTGTGFHLNLQTNIVQTKYSCGVALLQLPFYLSADLLAHAFNFSPDGFSPVYHWSINVAATFYLVLGFFFLNKFLSTRFNQIVSYLVLLALFLSTNLYYYSIDETGMSHVYSFSIFCIFIYYLHYTQFLEKKSVISYLLFGIICGTIILIRPTNVVFLLTYLFFDIDDIKTIYERIKRVLRIRLLIPILAGVIVIIIPQLIYWKYASGSFIHYSYGDEGFNWTKPQIWLTFFSPDNGLFTYTPFYLVIMAGLIYMMRNKIKNGIFILVLFMIISYIFSSWHAWDFGCSFGGRSFVEYLAILSIPIGHLIHQIRGSNRNTAICFGIILFALFIFNFVLTYSYDECFFGSNNWDWNWYFGIIKKFLVGKFQFHNIVMLF